jgi:hypothetical protein
VDRSLATFII